MGQRPSRDEYGDDSRTKPHRARGYNLLALGGAKPRPRREWDNPLASQPDSLARHNKTTLLHTANDASRQTRRIAYRRECDNRTKNTPSTHHQRRPPATTGGRIAANAAGQLIERVVRLFIANAEWGGWDGLHTKQAWAAPLPAGPLCQSGFDIL